MTSERGGRSLFPLARLTRMLRIRWRLFASIVFGWAVDLVLSGTLESPTRLLIGWNSGVLLYLAMTWTMMGFSDVHSLRRRAADHDEGEWTIILLAMAAALASLVAIGAELQHARLAETQQILRVVIAAGTLFASWFFIHTIMAQHYAHDFYLREESGRSLLFPDNTREPDYWDFLYVSFTIGAASQTSDVAIGSPRTRRVVLAHTVLSFLFNTAVLALGINVGASLL